MTIYWDKGSERRIHRPLRRREDADRQADQPKTDQPKTNTGSPSPGGE